MGFGETELLVLDRYPVLEHLHRFRALRIQAAIPEVDDGRIRFLAHQEARSRGHGFAVIVVRDFREFLGLHERRFLAGIDPGSLDFGQGGVFDGVHVEAMDDNRLHGGSRRLRYRCERNWPVRQDGIVRGEVGSNELLRVVLGLVGIVGIVAGFRRRDGDEFLTPGGFGNKTKRQAQQKRRDQRTGFRAHPRRKSQVQNGRQAFSDYFVMCGHGPSRVDCRKSGPCAWGSNFRLLQVLQM